MAVDYSAYRNSQTYKNQKSVYDNALKNSEKADAWSAALTGTQIGASIGWDATSKAIGAGLGAIAGIAANVFGWYTPNEDTYKGQLESIRLLSGQKAISAMENKNKMTSSLKRQVNATRASYNDTYGAGKFEEIEQSVMGLLGMKNTTVLSQVIAGLQYDNVAGEMKTRLVNSEFGEGIYDESDITKLLEANFSLSDLGAAYTDYIYETYMNADSSIGDAARQISADEADALQSVEMNEKEMQGQLAQQFLSAFFGQQSTDISNASALGSAQSEQASSGIKMSKSTANASKMQKFRSDLAKATYAATLEYYESQVQSQLESLSITRSQIFSRSEMSKLALKRQIKESVNKDVNNYLYGVSEGMDQWNDAASAEDLYVADTLAANDARGSAQTTAEKYLTKTTSNSTK